MRSIAYKRDSMLKQSVGSLVLAFVGGWVALQPGFGDKLQFVGGFLALCLPIVSVALFVRWLGAGAALSFDAQTLRISTLFRSTMVRWSDVRNIARETLTQSSFFGLIKQEVARTLVITAAIDGGFERSFSVPEDLLDMPKDAIPALVDEMAACWAGARNAPGMGLASRTAPVSAEPTGTASGPGGFDPDAAIARYMAQKKEPQPPAPAAPARPAFGRKGLSA